MSSGTSIISSPTSSNNKPSSSTTSAPTPPVVSSLRSAEESAMLGVLSKRISVDAANNVSLSSLVDAKYHKIVARRIYSSTFSPWRKAIHNFVFHNPWFTRIVYLCVFVNAILVVFDGDGIQEQGQDGIFLTLDIITWFFLVEVVLMMIASGVWVRKIGFFNSKTNVVNLILTGLALYDFFQRRAWPDENNQFRIVGVIARVTRLLRGFRTLAEIPSVRQLFDALQKSVSRLIDILILFVAFSLVIGLVGMQFFEKTMKYRCASPRWINCSFAETTEIPCLPVDLPDSIAALSPINNLTTNHIQQTFENDPSSVLDPRQASFVINENALCQPTISYTQYFDLNQAWEAVMLRQLTGSETALYTLISFPSVFFFNYFNHASLGSSSIYFQQQQSTNNNNNNNNNDPQQQDNNNDLTSSSGDEVFTYSSFENATIARVFVNDSIIPLLMENSTDYQLPQAARNNDNTLFHGVTCPYSQACVPYRNPGNDWISFDTVFPAFITMYFVTFLEGWSTIASYVMDARGTASLYFFCFLVLAGALFMLNLVLAILVDAFTRSLSAIQARDATLNQERRKQIEEERKEEEKLQQEKAQLKLSVAAQRQQQQSNSPRGANSNNNNIPQNSSTSPNSLDNDEKNSSSLFYPPQQQQDGGGIGGLDFGESGVVTDDSGAGTTTRTTNVSDFFSPKNADDINNKNSPPSKNSSPTTPTTSTSLAGAGMVLGFVRRKGKQIQEQRNEDTTQLSEQHQQDEMKEVNKKPETDRLDLLGGPMTSTSASTKPSSTTTLNRSTSSSSASKSKEKEKEKVKRLARRAEPGAPPVLGFRRQSSSNEKKSSTDIVDGNNNEEVATNTNTVEDSKKMMDLFEGDDPKQQSNLAYVGMVLSTSLALSGAAVNSQQVKDEGCLKAFISKAKFYGRLVRFVVRSKVVTKTWFNVTSAFLTFVNVVLLACVWHGMPDRAELGIFYATSVIALLFSIEIVFKLTALPFARFARDVMNIVDLVVSIGAVLEFTIARSTVVTALRCIRILRLLSVIDSLRDTVKILRKGLYATIPLIIVLVIFLYFYAVVGMALFGGKLCLSATPNRYSEVLDMFLRRPTSACSDKDLTSEQIITLTQQTADGQLTGFPAQPVATAFNFDNFGNSLLSTFVVFIGDNWASLMALSMDRTSIFVSIWYITCFTVAGFIIVNLFVAAMIDACANPNRDVGLGLGGGGIGGSGGEGGKGGDGSPLLEKGGALFGVGGGGPFHHKASMFLSPTKDPSSNNKKKNKKNDIKNQNKNKKNDDKKNTTGGKSSPKDTSGGQRGGERKQQLGGSTSDDNDDNDEDDDDDDYNTNNLLLRFKTISNLAASFRKKPQQQQRDRKGSLGSTSRHSSLSSSTGNDHVGEGLETTVYFGGNPGSPDLRNFSALASPNRFGGAGRKRGTSGIGGRLRSGSQRHHGNYRPVVLPGENDDDFDMILDDDNPASPMSSKAPNSNPNMLSSHADSDLNQTLLRISRTQSDLTNDDSSAGSFAALKDRKRSVQLADDEKRLTTAAAENAQQRSKMTAAQRLQRLARRAIYGEKAFSAAQREEDKFGKIMLAASRVIGVEVNELSDFDRALLLPYFEEIRNARKFEEAKHFIRRGIGYMIRHPLYRIFSVIWCIFNVVTYISLAQAFRAPDDSQSVYFNYTELLNAIVVNADILCQMMSVGLYTRHATRVTAGYFNSKLNTAKFILGLFSIAAAISSFIGTTDSTNALRIFSRVLPLWLYIPQHQPTMLILISVFDAVVSLGNVGFMAVLVWMTYSIMGTQLFRGTFFACSSTPSEDTWGDHTYTGDRIYTRAACLNQSHYWVTYPNNFDNIWESMETLFGVATTDDWSTIAFMTVSARDHDHAPEPGHNMLMAVYTCSFILIAALFLLNVFIAVLVNAYFETQERMERNIRHSLLLGEAGDLLDPQQRDFYDLYRRALCFVKKPPTVRFAKGTLRWWIRRISRANAFQLAILILTFTNVIVQFTAFTSAPPPKENLLIADLVFTIILFIMISMKIVGSGLRAIARESYWSFIEIIVVALNFSCSIAAIVFTFAPPERFSALELENNLDLLAFLSQSRILLLHRVMSATPGARVLVDTIVRSSQTLFSALMLLLLLFLTYSSLGLTLFGRVFGRDLYTNFWSIPRAMYTLLCVATFDGWQDIMSTSGATTPNCDPQIGDCGVPGASQVFFMSFIVLGQWVGISLFVAILVESFSRSERQERLRVQDEDVKRFRRMWKKHCRANISKGGDDATAASPMPIRQLPLFLMELGAPLGPVSSRMVFTNSDSRQTQLPEFPELKFAWALNAEKKEKENLAKHQKQVDQLQRLVGNQPHQQQQLPNDDSLAAPPSPSSNNNNTSNAQTKEQKASALLQELQIPSLPQMWNMLTARFTKIKTTAAGTAVAARGTDGTTTTNNNNLTSNSPSQAIFSPRQQQNEGAHSQHHHHRSSINKRNNSATTSDVINERFATRSDAEKLLAKLNLPTFLDEDGKMCVAQYSLFDALIRYYYGCALPPRTDLSLHELLLSSFGVTREESSKQISKPSSGGHDGGGSGGLVLRRERGVSGAKNSSRVGVDDEAARARRQLLGGVSATTFVLLNEDHDGDDGNDTTGQTRERVSKPNFFAEEGRRSSTGFIEILSDDDMGAAASAGDGPRLRTHSLEPTFSRSQVQVNYSIDSISVGAMFSIVRIQAIWRGARIRNKITRLAELTALGMETTSSASSTENNNNNNRKENDDKEGNEKENDDDELLNRTTKILDSLPLDSTISQAAMTLRRNPAADLAEVVDPDHHCTNKNNKKKRNTKNNVIKKKPNVNAFFDDTSSDSDLDDDNNNNKEKQAQRSSPSQTPDRSNSTKNKNKSKNDDDADDDGGEAEGGPSKNKKDQQQPKSGGVQTLLAVAKLAGIIDRNRQRNNKKEIRGEKVSEEERSYITSIAGAKTAMKAVNKFASILQKNRPGGGAHQLGSAASTPVALKGKLTEPKPIEKLETDDPDLFGSTFVEEGRSDDDDDDDERRHQDHSEQLGQHMASLLGNAADTNMNKNDVNKEKEEDNNHQKQKPSAQPMIVHDFMDL